MLEAYIDDSGTGQHPVMVLAGYMAQVEQWLNFSDEWQKVLNTPPKLDYFKMAEAAGLKGQFKGWSTSARDERLQSFISIIKHHVILGVASVIPYKPYRDIIKGHIAKAMDNPYFLHCYGIITGLHMLQVQNDWRDKVDFIFDEQGKQSLQVQAGYEALVKSAPAEIREFIGGRPIHRDDKKLLPLQAADLLAWHIRKSHAEPEFGSPFWDALCVIPCQERIWTAELLSTLLANCQRINRETGYIFPHDRR